MTTTVIIQARLNSQRMPCKVLAVLCGRPVLWHVAQRAMAIPGTDAVVVACPESDAETLDRIGLGVPVVGVTVDGDESDVLSRFAAVAEAYQADAYLRLTGDCPLLAPDLAEQVIARVRQGASYACTRHDGGLFGWPDGLDCECFTAAALRQADAEARPAELEHVTAAVRRLLPAEHQVSLFCPVRWPDGCKLSVDEVSDLDYCRAVMARIAAGQFGWRETFRAVEAEEAARQVSAGR